MRNDSTSAINICMSKIKFNIKASELSVLTGDNVYENLELKLCEIIQRHGLNCKTGYVETNKVNVHINSMSEHEKKQTIQELNLNMDATNADIEGKLKEMAKKCIDLKSVYTSKQNISSELKSKPTVNAHFKDIIEGHCRVQSGTLKEKHDLNRASVTVIQRNAKLYKKKLIQSTEFEVVLVGKVDGVTPDLDYVVETKNRRNGLLNHIPEYERVQIHAYMWLTGILKCIHIEHYNTEKNEIVEHFDQIYWEEKLRIVQELFEVRILNDLLYLP